MADARSIRSVSRTMSVICLAAGVVLAACVAWVWLLADADTWRAMTFPALAGAHVGAADPTVAKRVIGLGLTAIPLTFTLLALARLAGVFRRYSHGEIFSQTAIDGLSAVARWAMLAVVSKLIVTPALTVAMTYDNPPGEKTLAIQFSSGDMMFLIIAMTFLVIAWVMSEARRISDDLDQIV